MSGACTVVAESTITCPACSTVRHDVMPTDACPWFHECAGCQSLLTPKPGDCRVFCCYGDTPCPPVQMSGKDHCAC